MSDLNQVVQDGLAGVKSQVEGVRDDLQKQLDDLAQQVTTPTGIFGAGKAKSVSATVAADDQLAALRNRKTKSVVIPAEASIKAIVGDDGGSSDDPYNVQATRVPGVFNDPRRPLTLLEMMPSLVVQAGSFEFTALDGFTDAAGYQLAEGDAKAEQTMPTALKTVPIATIAAVLHASEQVLADSPALAQFIQGRLLYGVRKKLEAEIVAGAGGTGQISGLTTEAETFTASSGASSADAIGEAIAHLQALGWMPGAVVMHPYDWQAMRAERVDSGTGEYIAGGWDSPAGQGVWGVPVVPTAAIAEGTCLVMDPMQTMLLDRQSAVFQLGYVGDGFAENIITGRAELRAGLAVMAPSAVQKLTI